jgi:hypothetical protein
VAVWLAAPIFFWRSELVARASHLAAPRACALAPQEACGPAAPAVAAEMLLCVVGCAVEDHATVAAFLPRKRSPADRPAVSPIHVRTARDPPLPPALAGVARVVAPGFGDIPQELIIPQEDVTLLGWLGAGAVGDAFSALLRGRTRCVMKVRMPCVGGCFFRLCRGKLCCFWCRAATACTVGKPCFRRHRCLNGDGGGGLGLEAGQCLPPGIRVCGRCCACTVVCTPPHPRSRGTRLRASVPMRLGPAWVRCPALPCLVLQTSHKLENPLLWGLAEGDPIPDAWFEEVMKEATPFLSCSSQSPFVVRLVGVIVDAQGRPMRLLFELADRGDLERYIMDATDPSDLSTEAMGLWMCDSIAGLAHMHHAATEALLHRDLKPDNLLVFNWVRHALLLLSVDGGAVAGAGVGAGAGADADAGGGRDDGHPVSPGRGVLVKVADLSEARAVDPARTQRWTNSRVGNTLCMAPQAMQGKFNAAGDVYAWAMCMCVAVVLAVWREEAPPEVRPPAVRAEGRLGAHGEISCCCSGLV